MVKSSEIMSTQLSKSLFVRGLKCIKSLCLHKFHPELRDQISTSQEAIFKSGTKIGEIAQDLFPDGTMIPYEGLTYDEQLFKTRAAIHAGTKTIYEAAFKYDDIFIKADIMHLTESGWELYEVKSSTSVKDYHIEDLAVQYYVITGCGIAVCKAQIVVVNNQYVRNGDLNLNDLFVINDLTETILGKQPEIKKNVEIQKTALRGLIPQIEIGEQCDKYYECDFHGYCWKDIPDDSVFELAGRGINPYELYRQGIVKLADVPLSLLGNAQRIQVEMHVKQGSLLNADKLDTFVNKFGYPMCFLDFETFSPDIPIYDGTKPYQQIPFQYSMHIVREEGQRPEHYEYLAEPHIDPREGLLNKLMSEIPPNACVVAFNSSFEKMVLKSLSDCYPDYRESIKSMTDRMIDLAEPFRNKTYYDWRFKGSYSLKVVLPALVPELSYAELEINNGGAAMNAYSQMCSTTDINEMNKLRSDLLQYCKLDTLAMVEIYKRLVLLTRNS